VRDQVSHPYKTTGKTTVLYTLILGSCKHGNKCSGSIKCAEFIRNLRNVRLHFIPFQDIQN
jgi:hypothetical protein